MQIEYNKCMYVLRLSAYCYIPLDYYSNQRSKGVELSRF